MFCSWDWAFVRCSRLLKREFFGILLGAARLPEVDRRFALRAHATG